MHTAKTKFNTTSLLSWLQIIIVLLHVYEVQIRQTLIIKKIPFCHNSHSKYIVHHSLLPQWLLQIHCPALTIVTPNTLSSTPWWYNEDVYAQHILSDYCDKRDWGTHLCYHGCKIWRSLLYCLALWGAIKIPCLSSTH